MSPTITVDSPDTAADETAVLLNATASRGVTGNTLLCDNSGTPSCGHRIRPGEVWRFGIGFANGTGLTLGAIAGGQMTGQVLAQCP